MTEEIKGAFPRGQVYATEEQLNTDASKSELNGGLCQIDYEYVSEITCPYCGWKDRDSWEHGLRDGEDVDIECGQCDESFNVGCCIDVSYTSEKKA